MLNWIHLHVFWVRNKWTNCPKNKILQSDWLTKVLLFSEVAQVNADFLRLDLRVHATNRRRRPVLRQVIVHVEVVAGARTLQQVRLVDAGKLLDLWEQLLRKVGTVVVPSTGMFRCTLTSRARKDAIVALLCVSNAVDSPLVFSDVTTFLQEAFKLLLMSLWLPFCCIETSGAPLKSKRESIKSSSLTSSKLIPSKKPR